MNGYDYDYDEVEQDLETIKKALKRLPHDVNVRGGDGLDHDCNCLRCAASKAASRLYSKCFPVRAPLEEKVVPVPRQKRPIQDIPQA